MSVECPGAFDAAGFRFQTGEQEFTAQVVDDQAVDDETYVNGNWGGRRWYVTLEGEYDGDHGTGTYVFHATVEEAKHETVPILYLYLAHGFHDGPGEDQALEIKSATALDEDEL